MFILKKYFLLKLTYFVKLNYFTLRRRHAGHRAAHSLHKVSEKNFKSEFKQKWIALPVTKNISFSNNHGQWLTSVIKLPCWLQETEQRPGRATKNFMELSDRKDLRVQVPAEELTYAAGVNVLLVTLMHLR